MFHVEQRLKTTAGKVKTENKKENKELNTKRESRTNTLRALSSP